MRDEDDFSGTSYRWDRQQLGLHEDDDKIKAKYPAKTSRKLPKWYKKQ